MQKKHIIILIVTLFFLLIIFSFIGIYINYTINKQKDALAFKESYESLNNSIRESDSASYNNVYISEKNPIKEINTKQALKLLKNGNGIIYFGANWCPWCRTIIPILFESAKLNNVNTIYYLNIDSLNSGFELDENNELIRKEENISEGYLELIQALDKVLGQKTYNLKDINGNSYDTGEKTIYAPLVITVKKGIITSYHSGAISLNADQTKYDELSDEQKQTLLNMYNKMFKTLK